MKVARWYNNRDIRIETEEVRRPGSGEMLVKVMACGVCGSDLVEWYRLPRAPLVQGHEVGAEVVEVGDGVSEFNVGDRVFVAPKVPCMACAYCNKEAYPVCTEVKDRLPGGFAEYVSVPKELVKHGTYALPESIDYDQATFIEPLACAIRAQKLSNLMSGERIVVLGAGISGLLHIKLAKRLGCEVIATDVSEKRLEYAKAFGADQTVKAGDPLPGKADCVMVCTGAPAAIEQAWKTVDAGGAIVFFAVPGPDKEVSIPVNDLWRKEVRVLTSYYCGPPDLLKAILLLSKREITVDDMITHRLPLDEIEEGFRLVMEGEDSLKVVIQPNN